MRIRNLLCVIPLLFGLGGAAPASAQALVEYALILVLVETGAGTIVDELRIPSALEEDCLLSRDVAALCADLVDLEGAPLGEAMLVLDAWDGRLERAVPLDASRAAVLESPDCEAPTLAADGLVGPQTWRKMGGTSRRPSFGASMSGLVFEPVSSKQAGWSLSKAWPKQVVTSGSEQKATRGSAERFLADAAPSSCADRLQAQVAKGKPLLIIAEDVEGEALGAGRALFMDGSDVRMDDAITTGLIYTVVR